ncbi:hypothetical protein QWY81_17785 [Polaribacter undariae]|uniref:Uncharacterized protein n=1 Tax=Polaribacter sejongensis TaxID=985043 RepID=A0AAJ1QZP5_9FLAO|nr:hypothetical protein [Polaribacter undariae]MDN3621323.1 hypothetical protein [Polaribacter undariae]UWD31865.1 hypothetical protein NQP51_17250 [Polaribacter undariae]
MLINTFNDNSATDFVLQERSLSIAKAIDGTPLSVLEQKDRRETATQLIFLIKRVNDLINVGAKLNELQIATLASDLLDFCQHETLEDILMLFKMARKGELGNKIYRLDAMVIFQEWMPAYLELKYQEKERFLERKKSEQAAADMEASKGKWNAETKENYRKLQVSMIANKKEVKKPSEPYLQNSTDFEVVFKKELKELSEKELKVLKKEYGFRQSYKRYLELVNGELKLRLKSN